MRRATDIPALMRSAMALRVAVAGPIVQTMRVRGLSAMASGMGYTAVSSWKGLWGQDDANLHCGAAGANGGVLRGRGAWVDVEHGGLTRQLSVHRLRVILPFIPRVRLAAY